MISNWTNSRTNFQKTHYLKLNVYYCEDWDEYSKDRLPAVLSKRTLTVRGDKLSVELDTDIEIKEMARDKIKVNVMFVDRAKDEEDISGRYFAHIHLFERIRILWSYRRFWIQGKANFAHIVVGVISLAVGFITRPFILPTVPKEQTAPTEVQRAIQSPKQGQEVPLIPDSLPVEVTDTPKTK